MIIEELQRMDWAVFWSAMQAIGTVGALFFLAWEVIRLRRERVRYKWEGFKFASDFLLSDRFLNRYHRLPKARRQRDDGDMLVDAVYEIMELVEVLGRLVEENYVDKDLFISLYRGFLFRIRREIMDIHQRVHEEDLPSSYPVSPETRLRQIREEFPHAIMLLREFRTLPHMGEEHALEDQGLFER